MRRSLGAPVGLKRVFLRTSLLLEASWLAHPASLRGYWTQLQVYCSAQENGGRLSSVRAWGSQHWRMVLGNGGSVRVVARLIAAGLAEWAGDDLIVSGYDTDAEDGYQRKREGGRAGGTASAQRRAQREIEDQAALGPSPTNASSNAGSIPRTTAVEGRTAEASSAERGQDEDGRAKEGGAPTRAVRVGPDDFIARFGSEYRRAFRRDCPGLASAGFTVRPNFAELGLADRFDEIPEYIEQVGQQANLPGLLGWLRDRPLRGGELRRQ
jgi:hypothetical protein